MSDNLSSNKIIREEVLLEGCTDELTSLMTSLNSIRADVHKALDINLTIWNVAQEIGKPAFEEELESMFFYTRDFLETRLMEVEMLYKLLPCLNESYGTVSTLCEVLNKILFMYVAHLGDLFGNVTLNRGRVVFDQNGTQSVVSEPVVHGIEILEQFNKFVHDAQQACKLTTIEDIVAFLKKTSDVRNAFWGEFDVRFLLHDEDIEKFEAFLRKEYDLKTLLYRSKIGMSRKTPKPASVCVIDDDDEAEAKVVGEIYILTNPAFPQYVKIGYADDVKRRVGRMNSSSVLPFAFRVYATYGVTARVSDKQVHSIIDSLNPNLRVVEETSNGKRVREFYEMSVEMAYSLLESIAKLNGSTKRLRKWSTDETITEVEESECVSDECGLLTEDIEEITDTAEIMNETVEETSKDSDEVVSEEAEVVAEDFETIDEAALWGSNTVEKTFEIVEASVVKEAITESTESKQPVKYYPYKRATQMSFDSLQIPIGATLHYTRDTSITVTVADNKHVGIDGQVFSLTRALGYIRGVQKPYNGTYLFSYEGETLAARRARLGV